MTSLDSKYAAIVLPVDMVNAIQAGFFFDASNTIGEIMATQPPQASPAQVRKLLEMALPNVIRALVQQPPPEEHVTVATLMAYLAQQDQNALIVTGTRYITECVDTIHHNQLLSGTVGKDDFEYFDIPDDLNTKPIIIL